MIRSPLPPLRWCCIVALLSASPLFGQLTILSTSLPGATVGQTYTTGLLASGGSAPYTWSVTAGSLPAGIALNPGGSLFGNPTTGGSFSFTLTVADHLGAKDSRLFTLLVTSTTHPITITTASPLPPGSVGQSYQVSLSASGGTPPYQWTAASDLPPGMTLSPLGVLSGTPTAAGVFVAAVRVTDSSQASATANLGVTIKGLPLTISTAPPLFAGTVGLAYSQPFSASGGKPPYSWSISSGGADGLVLDASTGSLHGTPQTAGTFTVGIQVTDSANTSVSKTFSIVVTAPVLTITLVSSLASGVVGQAYNQKLPVVATGGSAPYTWSISAGLAPGLVVNPDTLTISGTPTAAGAFTLALRLTDSAQQTAAKSLAYTIAPAALSITTDRQLPDGLLNVSYAVSLAAAGGVPPYTWSAAGLPDGLRLDTNANIAGVPTAAGTFPVAITVSDGTLNHVSDRFTLTIDLPSAPPMVVSGLPEVAAPAGQYPIQMTLASTYPAPITGQAILTFSPDSGPTDKTVQFASGGTTSTFSIPTGATSPVSDVPLAIQTGTVSGTVNISIRLAAGGIDITPVPPPAVATRVGAAAPVINSVTVSRSDGQISLAVSGYSTAREVTQAIFTFAAATGQTLQSTASSLTLAVDGLFGPWFQDPKNAGYGSQFVLTQPFSVQGDSNAVIPQSVTLVNRIGSTTYTVH